MSAIEDLVKDNIKLPSPPAIAIRILEAVKKDDTTFSELAQIISSDPALAAGVLRMANSSFYVLRYKVDSIEKALSILGVDALKNIALSFVITRGLRGHSEDGFNFDFFWKRAVTAAVAADLIATLINHKNNDAFVTGLLQDIGVAIMYFCRTDDYMKVLDERKTTDLSVEAVEKRIFSFDHQEVGSEILKEWGLPESIWLPVRHHHKNKKIPSEYMVRADILFLSDKISSVYHGTHGSEKIQILKDILGNTYGISERDTDSLIDSVASKSIEILSFFDIEPGDMKPFSQILQEANEELKILNVSYEQLVMELKEAKDRAEKLASELKHANEKLRKLALTDGLTGLYNHRYFQELMDIELGRAMRYKRPFSLIMIDLDHFKKINDNYGHPAGDIVLKEISAAVHRSVRTSDVVARYGGEEFVIILPETDLKGAKVLAERLRICIEQMKISANADTVKITISVGITTYVPGKKKVGKAEVLEAADRALYNSKNTGRNKLSIGEITCGLGHVLQ